MNNIIKNICCLGAGYVGGPTMAVIAYKCSNLIVNVVDSSQQKVDAWNDNDLNKLPVFEPGLDKIISEVRGKNLFFSSDIEKNISDLGQKARDGQITIEDLQGGTFTITNGGIYGSMLSTPILNPPQSAVLGMHNIVKRPVVVNDSIEVRPVMYLALSYDHRIVDGKEAVSFLKIVKESLEQPKRLFLNI